MNVQEAATWFVVGFTALVFGLVALANEILKPLPVKDNCLGCGDAGCEWCGQGGYQ